jgi:hypothetical protein
MHQFFKGDVVTVRGVVEFVHDGDIISVKLDGAYQNTHLASTNLTFVHSHFDIGERVWVDDLYGHVRAINGAMAWVEREDRADYVTLPLSDLQKAPVGIAEAAE